MDAIVSVMQNAAEEAQVERIRQVPVRMGVVEQALWPEASRRGDSKDAKQERHFRD